MFNKVHKTRWIDCFHIVNVPIMSLIKNGIIIIDNFWNRFKHDLISRAESFTNEIECKQN